MSDGAAGSEAGVRKPPKEETALGGRRTFPRNGSKSRQTTSDDQWGRRWGFNVWRRPYFQGLGRRKNTTPHNLDVSSLIFESQEAN